MQDLNEYIRENYEGVENWFEYAVKEQWQQGRVNQVLNAKEYLAGNHLIKQREMEYHNNKPFKPSAIILNYAKTITQFQTQFLLKNDLVLNCEDEGSLNKIKEVYKKGKYKLLEPKIAGDLINYGEVYEYVFVDNEGKIKSRLIDAADSYPIYDDFGNMIAFIHYYVTNSISHYEIYTDDKVLTYNDKGGDLKLIGEFDNISGLPVSYILPSETDELQGISSINDYVDVLDAMEKLVSKYHDAFYKYLQPTPVVTGSPLNIGRQGEAKLDPNIVGYAMQLQEDGKMEYLTGKMDFNSLKTLYTTLKQALFDIAGMPSVIAGGAEISNVSETSIKLLYSLSQVKAYMFEQRLQAGYQQRYEQINKILKLQGKEVDIEDVEVIFEYNIPSNEAEVIDNLKDLREMEAISLKTLHDKAPYIYDSKNELELIKNEKNLNKNENIEEEKEEEEGEEGVKEG